MKKLSVFVIILLFSSLCAMAQDGGDNSKHMAFYGVDNDTARHSHDTIFRLDSSHIALYISAGATFNSQLQHLAPDPHAIDNAGGQVTPSYISTLPATGFHVDFGLEYLSKEINKRIIYSIGLEAFYAGVNGNINVNTVTHYKSSMLTDSVVSKIQHAADTISVIAISVPIKVYYVLSEKKNHRLSLGLGLTLGYYVYQKSSIEWYLSNNIANPMNLASLSLKYDVSIKGKTGLSFEPYFSGQMLDNYTHLMFLGLKVASL